ncbi:MAG TPA: CHASE2 domain-containing protein [Bdellovibrionales bacterium]|nr:CHASE2 domain-containing protein [Bdellovibrionales bacterium]
MKSLKKFASYLISPFALGVVVSGAIAYASLVYYGNRGAAFNKEHKTLSGFVQEMHEKTVDWRLRARGAALGSDRVAILAVDDESLRLEGRWPWPRDKVAKLVDRTMMYGAKAIAFDVIFSEEDNNSALPALTRLKTAFEQQRTVASEIPNLIEEETSIADLDRIFATTIAANQDHLIMGSYPDGEVTTSGFQELCLDANYARTYANRYWKREASPLAVIDTPLQNLNYPRGITEHLSQYFMTMESSSASDWFEKNTQASERITKSLGPVATKLDPEMYPAISVMSLSNDFLQGRDLLSQIDPAFEDLEFVRTTFSRFNKGLDKKEFATLQSKIRKAGFDYCARFFTDDDELLNIDKYKKMYTDSPEAMEIFNALSWEAFWKEYAQKDPEAGKEDYRTAIARIVKQTAPNGILQAVDFAVNIPLLSESTLHTGLFNAVLDSDGSIRRTRLFTRHGNNYAPSLALKAFLVDRGYSAVAKIDYENVGRHEARQKVLRAFEIMDKDGNTKLRIPTDETGHVMINYSGPQAMFPHVSATEVLSDGDSMRITLRTKNESTGLWEHRSKRVNKREFLKDKVLVFGATAMAVYDLRVTPFEENFPGVETHANVLSNLLVEDARARGERLPASAPGFLRIHPTEEKVMWIVLLGLGLVLSALLSYFGSVAGLGIATGTMAGVYFFDKIFLFNQGIVSTIVFPQALVGINFVTLTFYKYFTEERKKQALNGTFSKYVSPAIVDEILKDPQNIELGGKKMELTVMFSDVRGFTTISEKLDPRALSDLLNSYLTPMTNLVFEHKGTLDKYMGDAIMAFWGAPIHFKDHAKHACRCALAMLVKLRELQAQLRAQNLPEIDIGIGLNTGDMSVGNMGSDTVRSYTVMGDSVNLGSRLEGINKEYGTRIIISEFTFAAVKDSFVCREVDWVRVKGKNQPVRIFELIAEGKAPEPIAGVLPHFQKGFDLYHERKFSEAIECFNQALAVDANDAVTQLYVERCQDYVSEPPPADWDGVYVMKTK